MQLHVEMTLKAGNVVECDIASHSNGAIVTEAKWGRTDRRVKQSSVLDKILVRAVDFCNKYTSTEDRDGDSR